MKSNVWNRLVVRPLRRPSGIALALLAFGQFGTIQAGAGRDFSRCVQSCNETKFACKAECRDDCKFIFPKGEERTACVIECKDVICVANSNDCKDLCVNIRNPPTPEEP